MSNAPDSPKATEHDPQSIVDSSSPIREQNSYDAETTGSNPPTGRGRVKQYFASKSKSWGQMFSYSSNGGSADGGSTQDGGSELDTSTLSKKEQRKSKRQQQYELALEGVVQLDDSPILQCHEIYNKFIGNHQTSLVTKEDVLTLLKLDREEHEQHTAKGVHSPDTDKKKGTDGDFDQHVAIDSYDNNDNDNDSLVAAVTKEEKETAGSSSDRASGPGTARRISGWASKFRFRQSDNEKKVSDAAPSDPEIPSPPGEVAVVPPETSDASEAEKAQQAPSDSEPSVSAVENGAYNVENAVAVHDLLPTHSLLDDDDDDEIDHDSDGGQRCAVKSTDEAKAKEQEKEYPPLVAYWQWKNTMRVHKMQLHLGKNSDLALHVVLAILVNQVRYERNALAMTV